MIIIENRTVPCNPRSKNYAKGTVVNVSGAASMSTFVYTPTYDDIINALKNGKDYITIPTILEVYGDLYSLGEVSAFGAGSGGSSGGGLIQTVYGYSSLGSSFNDSTLTDTFNAYTINQLHTRLSQVEVGAAINVTVSGIGNAVTGVAKNGNVLEFTKGVTFSVDGHTHSFASLTGKPTTLLGYGITDAYTKTYVDNTFLKLTGGTLTGSISATNYLRSDGNTIWHSGNDGDGSGLDADTLDGIHYQNILERDYSGTSNSGTATGWFRIATFISDNGGSQDCILIINREYNYANSEAYKFSISAAYNGGINITQLSGYANTRLIDKIRVDYVNDGIAYIELHISTSTTNNSYRWTTIGTATSYTEWVAVSDTPNGTSYEFTTVNGCKSDRGFTGNIVGNASTATKLQTARTIAGVSFDGTDNISIPFANLTSKPTTLSGYGITDAYTKYQIDSFLALKLDVATFNDLFEKVNIGTELSPVYAIKAKYNFYSVGEVSAFGAGSGSGGSGLIQTVYGYSGLGGTYNNATLTDTFNAYTINKINTDLGTRITSLEAGSALTFTTVGSGNAVTSVTKSGTSVTVTKGLTFSVDGHTHSYLPLSGGTLSGNLTAPTFTGSLSGNSSSATKLETARTIAGVSFDGTDNISIPFANLTAIPSTFAPSPHNHENIVNWSNAQTTAQTYSQLPNGVSVAFTDIGGGYGSYGSVLNIKAYPISGGGTLQLYIPYSNTYGGTGLKYRKFNYDGDWGSLNTIWDSGNFTNLNQLTTRNFSDLQNKPTTLAGYGITDALLASSYTAADVLTKIKTVDGSGSGLDADLLDGIHYQNILERLHSGVSESGTATGWFRIARMLGSVGSSGLNCILSIHRGYSYADNEAYTFSISAVYGGGINITQLSGYANTRLIDKIRIDYTEGSAYIELHISTSTTNNSYRWTTIGTATSYTEWVAVSDTPNGTSYEFTTVNGCKSDRGFTGNIVGNTSSFSSYSTAARFYAGYDSNTSNSMSCSGWFRSNGTTGWINDTYGGGINMTDSTYVRVYNNKSFWVDNNIVATGEITAFGASDIRLKSNIKPINSALGFLGKVKTYEFDWNEKAISLNPLKTKKGAGVIAQEMSLLDNNFVHSIYGDYLGVDYERFIPYLIGGVNELSKKMYDYGNRLDRAEKRVAELELEVKRLIA